MAQWVKTREYNPKNPCKGGIRELAHTVCVWPPHICGACMPSRHIIHTLIINKFKNTYQWVKSSGLIDLQLLLCFMPLLLDVLYSCQGEYKGITESPFVLFVVLCPYFLK